jgi:hypothetical protein
VSAPQWWLTAAEYGVVLWARLTLDEEGRADLLEASGMILRFDDEDVARHHLLGSEYRAFDGLDEDDARVMGATLEDLVPPEADSDEQLVPLMTQRVGG